MGQKIEVLDSTLRDGAQGEGISFSVADKLSIARELDTLGIDFIEAGNPMSNIKDREFFRRSAELNLKTSRLVAFGSTRRKNITAEEDEGLSSMLSAGTKTVAVFGKCSRLHVDQVLRTTGAENADMIEQSCRYLTDKGREVYFDGEHFYDGYKTDRQFALDMLAAALRGGAAGLVLCDTNGGMFPDEVAEITLEVVNLYKGIKIGVHCHNDSGMGVASSVAAVMAGATHVQGTLLGIGERCGNAALASIIPNLQLKKGYELIPQDNCAHLTHISRAVAEICNVSIKRTEPFIGRSAFTHKAGMHVDAVRKSPVSFEHLSPELVGNERRTLISEVAGRGALLENLRRIMPRAEKDSEEMSAVISKLKQLEYEGYQFEGAQASFELMMRRCIGRDTEIFQLCNYKIICQNPHDPDCSAAAIVKIKVGESEVLRSAEGRGPVNALDKALRHALSVFYPQLSSMRLTDYKVRVMDSASATASTVRVVITSSDGRREWSTVGVSKDIIEASFAALCDSVEYMLIKDKSLGVKPE